MHLSVCFAFCMIYIYIRKIYNCHDLVYMVFLFSSKSQLDGMVVQLARLHVYFVNVADNLVSYLHCDRKQCNRLSCHALSYVICFFYANNES